MTAIDLPGVRNLRDVGGERTRDGRVVASGRLYRAELLTDRGANESNAEWTAEVDEGIAALGLTTVIDLRSVSEKDASPSRWVHDGTQYVEIPIDDGAPGSDTDLMKDVLDGVRESFTVDDLAVYYRSMFDGRAREFALGVRAVAEGVPALIHCSAGKDRTGALTAMVLELVGVDRDSVIDDYEETGRRRPNRAAFYTEYFEKRGLSVEQVRVMFETPGEALRDALDDLDARYGSIEAYLTERGGLAPETVERLRAALLVAAP